MTTTAARTTNPEGGHWYTVDGQPAYEVAAKSGEMRPTTLRDARKLNLLPSVTTILKILHKQGLQDWLIEQAVLAALTTPRLDGEELDAFVNRVLHTERVQDQESQRAKDRGTEIHNGIETVLQGGQIAAELEPWVMPVTSYLMSRGTVVATEKILVGDGYAGRVDLIQNIGTDTWIWDFKTTKKLPKSDKAWDEHVLQLGAYAAAHDRGVKWNHRNIRTGNIYISTLEPGEFAVCEHDPETLHWGDVYWKGFKPILEFWQWSNRYKPEQP